MGLAYLFLFIMILGVAGIAVALVIAAWNIWKKARFKIFYPFALGYTLCGCSILSTGNRLERTALGISFLMG